MKHFLLISYENITGIFFTPKIVIIKISDTKQTEFELLQNPQWQRKQNV